MVQDLFLWSFKVSLLLTLMYGAYWLLFRKNTHFQLRRIIILSCLILAAIVPMVEVETQLPWSSPIETGLESAIFDSINPVSSSVTFSGEQPTQTVVTDGFSWKKFLLKIYLAGLFFALGLFLFEISKLSIWYYYGARRTDIQDNVITHKGIKYPFSFWKWIFIPQGTDYDQDIWEIIEKHETAHLNQYHTFDMVLVNLAQSLLWYNPLVRLVQKELKENHEALADQSVLTTTDFKVYAQALIKVSINSSALKLGHSFALISTLSKRITAMQKQKTTLKRTLSSLFILSIMTSMIIGMNVLKAQDTVVTREAAFEEIKNRAAETFSWLSYNKLTLQHRAVLKKLQVLYPDKTIHARYCADTQLFEYEAHGRSGQKPLYFDKLDRDDKNEVFELIKSDTSRLKGVRLLTNPKSDHSFDVVEFMDEIENSVDKVTNYIVFYEYLGKVEDEIFDISEVDAKPEPIGGIEAFVRAIALDIKLPKNIKKSDLPPTIDFEVVINGGILLTNIKLLTQLKGSDKKNKNMYLFFGKVHNMMIDKTRELHTWKRGIKDGKEVRVRTTIAIPTKYM